VNSQIIFNQAKRLVLNQPKKTNRYNSRDGKLYIFYDPWGELLEIFKCSMTGVKPSYSIRVFKQRESDVILFNEEGDWTNQLKKEYTRCFSIR
jgi:hypothetical protein